MKPVVRILLGYSALAMLAGMAVTFSRGGWMAVAVALLVLLGTLIFHRNHRLPALLLLFVLAGGGTIFVTNYLSKTLSYMHRVGTPGQTAELDLAIRLDIWTAAEQMCGIIFGGASGRRITTIVSGNIVRKMSR